MLPTYFLAHGTPTNALEKNRFTQDWHNITQNLKNHATPKAIVVISAHWHVPGTFITSNQNPSTLHDFGGFSQALFDCQYPCPGSPQLVNTIQNLLTQVNIQGQTTEQWGLDHGSWVILKHLYPNADIPVLQISMDSRHNNIRQHYNIGQALKSLRNEGVLFIGSGNIVHNIKKWMQQQDDTSINWAVDFDQAISKALLINDFDAIESFHRLPFANDAVPTIEHFLPLIYCLGLSGNAQYDFSECNLSFSQFPFDDLSTACSRSIEFS